jgi:serine/threonine protein phosphatase PrpC
MRMQSAALTYTGRRKNNEDDYCCVDDAGLFAVADGMGGYEGGEVASRLTVEALERFVRRVARDGEATWPHAANPKLTLQENVVSVAVHYANDCVLEQRKGPLAEMGATVAAIYVRGNEAVICHVGDSRVYRLRDGALQQLTRDHSLYAEMQAKGLELPPREEYPYANVITRALGVMNGEQPELRREEALPGDTFLLCTDGLTEKLPESEMARLLASSDLTQACEALVSEAYNRGGRDNITCVLVRLLP